jgi:lipopolysaccharide transport system permease protein
MLSPAEAMVSAYIAVSVVMTIVLLLTGVVVFNKVEKTFVDTV